MITIHLDSSKEGFLLSGLPYTKLKLKYNESEYLIEQNHDIFIIKKEILHSIAHHKESIIKLFGKNLEEDTYKEINLTEFFIESSSPLYFNFNGKDYYLYNSQQNTLRIITNQKPSVMSYYKKNLLTIIAETTKEITFQLNVTSSHFKFTNCTILIKDRDKKNETSFLTALIDTYPINFNEHITIFEFSINKDILKTLYPLGFHYTNYDTSIFDLFFTLSIKEQPITNYAIRLHYFTSFTLDEHWIDLDSSYKILIRTYPTTTYHNLSFRLSIVPAETYLYYQSINKQLILPKETHKKIILVAEYPHKAQDTGFSFFKYLYMNHKTECDVYYVISEDSKDLLNLEAFKNNTLIYKSKEHLQLFFAADVLAHSHNSLYGFPFVTDFLMEKSKSLFKVFLQHGLQSIRDVSYLYGKKSGISFTDLFIVSSEREKNIVVNNYFYNDDEVAITGLSRFDSLLSPIKTDINSNKKILIMPSWRKSQDKLTNQEFMDTHFFKAFQALLHNKKLKEYSLTYKAEILFYLHTNFQKYSHLFESDFVTIIFEGSTTVQHLLKSSAILITDFSSVSLDFALLKRPIIFYHFDGSPIEARTTTNDSFFPGAIVYSEEDLLSELWKLKPKSIMKPVYQTYLPDLYKYDDTFACQRIYNEIISRISD